ncbi:MAG: glycosyltransferase family 2 protein [Anaerolineales bacterium]
MNPQSITLSIIIPAYNEEQRLSSTLEQVAEFVQTQTYACEVLVVENGSTDRTLDIAREYAARFPFIRAIHEDGRGKGLAVRRGMLEASGGYRFMCDADLSMPVEEIARFIPPAANGADIVIGSREAEGAQRFDEPESRHIGGRLVNGFIRLLALPGLHDTQCGFKLFTARAAEDLFAAQTLMGWSFDIEILFIARRRGNTIKEIGIPWHYSEFSHVSPVKDALRMAWDILAMWVNYLRGVYQPAPR